MPANLTPQYLEAEKRYKQAVTPSDKVSALEEMLAVIPKHKGTEKLQADLKSRLSKCRAELQKPQGPGRHHGRCQHLRPRRGWHAAISISNWHVQLTVERRRSGRVARVQHAARGNVV